jgi:hypothetical protein
VARADPQKVHLFASHARVTVGGSAED